MAIEMIMLMMIMMMMVMMIMIQKIVMIIPKLFIIDSNGNTNYDDDDDNDYKNPLHLDVVDRYLRRKGENTIPNEAPPSLESFYPHASQYSIYHNQGVVDSLSRSPINTNRGVF